MTKPTTYKLELELKENKEKVKEIERDLQKDDIDDILRNCNFSDTFIQQANDLQIMEAINECYDEYKLLEF